jgi:hypothetical protein
MGFKAGTREGHSYQDCPDEDCQRYACRIYREGFADGYGAGHAGGVAEGRAEGYAEGYSDGAADAG